MAENLQNNSPSKNKIECNRNSVILMLKCFEDKTRQTLSDVFQDAELESFVAKVCETYRKTLLANICIGGQNVTDLADTSSEYEPLDTAKEHYIMHDLEDKFHQQVTKTTQLRKSGPKQATKKLKSLIRPQIKYASLVEISRSTTEKMDTDDNTECVSLEVVKTKCEDVTENTQNWKSMCDRVMEQTQSLTQAYEIFRHSENNDIVKVLNEVPSNTPVPGTDQTFIGRHEKKMKKLLLPST